jgi:hypothetical protein
MTNNCTDMYKYLVLHKIGPVFPPKYQELFLVQAMGNSTPSTVMFYSLSL